GGLDVAGAHGTEQLHLLGQRLLRALGEVAHDGLVDVGAHALERDGQLTGVDGAQHLLDRAVVEGDDVLEHEHQRPDLFGELRVVGLEAGQDRPLRAAVGVVEHRGELLDAASTCATTAGSVRSIIAMRRATSACSSGSSPASTCDENLVGTWARISAMVCGCSSRTCTITSLGSCWRRNANGVTCTVARRRS